MTVFFDGIHVHFSPFISEFFGSGDRFRNHQPEYDIYNQGAGAKTQPYKIGKPKSPQWLFHLVTKLRKGGRNITLGIQALIPK